MSLQPERKKVIDEQQWHSNKVTGADGRPRRGFETNQILGILHIKKNSGFGNKKASRAVPGAPNHDFMGKNVIAQSGKLNTSNNQIVASTNALSNTDLAPNYSNPKQRGHSGKDSMMKTPRDQQLQQVVRDYQPRIQNSFVKIYKQNYHVASGALGSRTKKMQMRQDGARQNNNESIDKGRQRAFIKATEHLTKNFESTPTLPMELRQMAEKPAHTEEVARESNQRLNVSSGKGGGGRSTTSEKYARQGMNRAGSRELPSSSSGGQGQIVSAQHNISQIEIVPGGGGTNPAGTDGTVASHEESNTIAAQLPPADAFVMAESEALYSEQQWKQSNYGTLGELNRQHQPAAGLLRHQNSVKNHKSAAKTIHQRTNLSENSQNSEIFRLRQQKDASSESFVRSFQKNRHHMNKSQNTNITHPRIEEKSAIYATQNTGPQKRKSSMVSRRHLMQIQEDSKFDENDNLAEQEAALRRGAASSTVNKRTLHQQHNASSATLQQSKGFGGLGNQQSTLEDSPQQISLPKLRQVNNKQLQGSHGPVAQGDTAAMLKRGKQATYRQQPYVDDAGSSGTGRNTGTADEKQPAAEKAQYKSYDQIQRVAASVAATGHSRPSDAAFMIEENYGDITTIMKKNTVLALSKDKSAASNQHSSGHKERYSTSPYSNGLGVARAVRQLTAVNKDKHNLLNTNSERGQLRDGSLQHSVEKPKVPDLDQQMSTLDGNVLRVGKNQVMLAYSYPKVQSQALLQQSSHQPSSRHQRLDQYHAPANRVLIQQTQEGHAISNSITIAAHVYSTAQNPPRKEHQSALLISKNGQSLLDNVGPQQHDKQTVDHNNSSHKRLRESVEMTNSKEDRASRLRLAAASPQPGTSMAITSHASFKSHAAGIANSDQKVRQEANGKNAVEPTKAKDGTGGGAESTDAHPHIQSNASSHRQTKRSEQHAAERSAVNSQAPESMPPIVVAKSQVTMATLKNSQHPRQHLSEQKGARKFDLGSRFDRSGAEIIRVQPGNNMRYDLLKIQQQIKNTQKEQRRLEKDLQLLRRDKNAASSNPELNLHNYYMNKKQYDASKDVYRQQYASIPKQKKTSSKPQSKKHSIVGHKQPLVKQGGSVVNVFNKMQNMSADERALLKPVSSRARMQRQPMADAAEKQRQSQRTPDSSSSARQLDQENVLDTIQTHDVADSNEASSKKRTLQTVELHRDGETPAHSSRHSKKRYSADKKQQAQPRSKSNSKGKYTAVSKAEEEKLLAEMTRATKIPGHNYQTISSARKDSSSKARGGVKSLESSYSPKKLTALSQSKKTRLPVPHQMGSFREPQRDHPATKILASSSAEKVLPPQRAQQPKLGSIQKKEFGGPGGGLQKGHQKMWRDHSTDGNHRLESPLKLKDHKLSSNQKDPGTRRNLNNGAEQMRGGQTPTRTLQHLTNSYLKQTPQKAAPNAGQQASGESPGKDAMPQKKFQLHHLEVLKSLGQGSFGKVKLVRHSLSGELYAMKCLAKEAIRGQKQIQHIKNEKHILEKFKSKDFCCNIHETLQDDVNLYMILDYLPGGELFKQIKNQVYLSEADTRFYLAEVVLAIEQLHQMNIIYRDLKPENILIDKDGHIKLIDFGFSKSLNNIKHDRAYTNCGTAGYCAPEVMLDAGYSYKADVWSLGILICEMMGGFIPFQNKLDANNPRAIMEKCRNGTLNLPKNLTGIARDLVKSLLTEDPHSRLEIDQIKQHKFFRSINWGLIRYRNVDPPFIPQPMDYYDEEPLRSDSFNMRNQQQRETKDGDTKDSASGMGIDFASQKLKQSKSSSSFIDDLQNRQLQDESDQAVAIKKQYSQQTTGQSLPLIDLRQSPGRRLTKSKARKLEQIPESLLDAANQDHDMLSDDKPSRNHLQVVNTSADAIVSSSLQNERPAVGASQQQQILAAAHEKSYYSSKKYSATGGTGGLSSTVHRKVKMPTKVLGDYQQQMINKAFVDF